MARPIEFHFDFMSPYSYLATTQFDALHADIGAEIVYRPFRILELMKLVGNQPTPECRNKLKYAGADIGRWAARYQVPFQRNPNMRGFDFDVLRRPTLVAIELGQGDACVPALYRAVWAADANLAARPVLAGPAAKAAVAGRATVRETEQP